MEWFIEDARRGQIALTVIALCVAGAIVWLGRKKFSIAIPVAMGLLLLAAFAIPSAIPARPTAQRNACIHNLGLIRDAKLEWAKQNNKRAGDIPTEVDIFGINGSNGYLGRPIFCPSGGVYTLGRVGVYPVCSFANKGHKLE